jgi:2'-5' RNA ligase
MITLSTMNLTEPAGKDAFALVTYVPDPLRTRLLELRESLDVEVNSEPHLTVLPPRPLTLALDEVVGRLGSILSGWRPFRVELSHFRVFSGSNVLFLEIAEGGSSLERLHAELNEGEIAHEEIYPFHPHVTVGGIATGRNVEATIRQATEAWQLDRRPCCFDVDELTLVRLAGQAQRGDWRRLWDYRMPRGTPRQRTKVQAVAL